MLSLSPHPLEGSSPLTRGAPPMKLPAASRWGLIPARAGNTDRKMTSLSIAGAHPRSRGEHSTHPVQLYAPTGSSPLARGARYPKSSSFTITGLIPARAGSTVSHNVQAVPLGAHPRSRGEHSPGGALVGGWSGSSPLARGARLPLRAARYRPGLIPARAGSTCCAYRRR